MCNNESECIVSSSKRTKNRLPAELSPDLLAERTAIRDLLAEFRGADGGLNRGLGDGRGDRPQSDF